MKTTFANPKTLNQFGTSLAIWADATTTNNTNPLTVNADRFCADQSLGAAIDNQSTIGCGEDESSYVDWSTSQGKWIGRSSGSSNRCYDIFASITCGL